VKTLLRVILVLCLCGAVKAGDGGTRSVFSFGAGARELSLGGAAVALSDPATSPYWNPSLLARAEQFSATGFHMQLFDSDASYQYSGFVAPPLDFGTFGLGVFRLGVDGIDERDASNISIGEISEERLAIYLGYARTFKDFDIGAAVSMEHQSLADFSANSSPGFHLSIARSFDVELGWLQRISVAAVGRNLVRPQIKLVEDATTYPYEASLGIAFEFMPGAYHQNGFTLFADLSKADYVDYRVTVGAEYSYENLLHVRGGLREDRASIGAGIGTDVIRFDYALIERDLGTMHMFALTSSFGTPKSERLERRKQEQETRFNRMMIEQLSQRNVEAVERLTIEGRQFLDAGQPQAALTSLERALFLARGASVDTTALSELVVTARAAVDEEQQLAAFTDHLKSARTALATNDFVMAQYWANEALDVYPEDTAAKRIAESAHREIQQSTRRQELVSDGLKRVDSLLTYGHATEALNAALSLRQLSPNDESVRASVSLARAGYYKQVISDLYGGGEYERAKVKTDSALAIFPNHQWFAQIADKIDKRLHPPTPQVAVAQQAEAVPELSSEIRDQAKQLYDDAGKAYEAGDLETAIARWEQVERIAPNFESVRAWLVNAYKYMGVEYYGSNRLQDAIAVWEKAQKLDPGSTEIAEYVRRARSELHNMQELSYEEP